ncbi:hypothetical protein DPEC_G00344690 [Dallia pectoralis]|uniref:Uncharacterized protein n=1 Tax=Dallia pectoralis TaxID=75939 RepID=A0ACC2F3B3_DALPE|nr:hypothetical protein DPEC_G00344690 [Dallia pectoralis]
MSVSLPVSLSLLAPPANPQTTQPVEACLRGELNGPLRVAVSTCQRVSVHPRHGTQVGFRVKFGGEFLGSIPHLLSLGPGHESLQVPPLIIYYG